MQNSSDYKLEFTLKQHTPIIHFQADQKGATLRATELKPKLDRFLIEKLKMLDENKKPLDKYKSWFIGEGKQHLALDYKVRIDPNCSDFVKNDKQLKNYFGNQGSAPRKYSRKYDSPFKIEFIVFNSALKSSIETSFAQFLATNNFGTRSSKGYGSFYLHKNSKGYQNIEEVLPKNTYYLEIDKATDIDETIKYFWQQLKSGINPNFSKLKLNENITDRDVQKKKCNDGYKKAFLVKKYSNWDKAWIKKTFFSDNSETSRNYFFARALLGLSSTFSYKRTNEPCRPGDNYITIEDEYSIDVYHKDISRIPSPLIFKPIESANNIKIFLIIDDTHIQKILQQQQKDFIFVKKFKFVKSDFIDKRKKFRVKSKLFPPYSIKSQNIFYSIPREIQKTKNWKDSNSFSYKKQYQRFHEFLNKFCEKKDSNPPQYKAKIQTLPLPQNFNFFDILCRYILSLDNQYNFSYRNQNKDYNVQVLIKRISDE